MTSTASPRSLDGLLVVDKPIGPTSHDVVARLRRTLKERRIGHTGTLDPIASGVLPLVIGRATRLARFLSGSVKAYEATVRLGVATDTCDRTGIARTPPHAGPMPDRPAIERALDEFRGTFQQWPPAYSAKKIDGTPSHRLARRAAGGVSEAPQPAPATVTAYRIEVRRLEGSALDLTVECSAGFYVRSLAQDLGERLGVGAHLEALRRTRSGDLTLADAVSLEAIDGRREAACGAIVPLRDMLPSLPAVRLTGDGVRLARHGRLLGEPDTEGGWHAGPVVRLLGPDGELVGLARPATPTGLHPYVVLT